jgi:putative ABC transport system permease protein
MKVLASLRSLAAALFHRSRVENEMDEELRAHIEDRARDLEQSGLPRPEAERRARIEFGGFQKSKEECREAIGTHLVEALAQDIRYGLRMLRKSPGFTTVGVLTLALGIGANTAIFSVIEGVLLVPPPYYEPGRLAVLWENDQRHTPHNVVAPPDFLDWQKESSDFAGMAATGDERDNMTGAGEPEQVAVQLVTANFFSVLGVKPVLGRGITEENGVAGKDNVVVLSYAFWKSRFGGDPRIIGQTIELNGQVQSIVGVAPRDFTWFIREGSLTGERPEMWSPFVFPASFRDRAQVGRFLTVVGRLNDGVTFSEAQAQMSTIASRLAAAYPDFNRHWGVTVVRLGEQLTGPLRPALLILLGAVGFVLLIACANVSSLLLARATGRQREMAMRTALGASRWRLARQLLTESMLLAALGGALGTMLANWGTNALLAASPKNLLGLSAVSIDWRVLGFATAATFVAGLLFGFLPSYVATHSAIGESLKQSGRGMAGGKRGADTRSAFVVAQMALALVLLVGSGLLVRSFVTLLAVDPGFQPDHLLTFKVALPGKTYPTDQAGQAFFRRLLDRVRVTPGVNSVTMENFPPLTGLGAATAVHILSQPKVPQPEMPVANVRVVGPYYFQVMEIPLVAGRTFSATENAEARHVVIVNRAFVDDCLHGANPLGQQAVIYMKSDAESEKTPSTIVGVVGNVRQMGLDQPARATVYWPYPELLYSHMSLIVRTSGDPLAVVSPIRGELHQLDPNLPLASLATMDQLLANSLSRARFTMELLVAFAAIALGLAAVGIYGVMASGVALRTQEIGVRMALGAQRRDVMRLVLGKGTWIALAGVGIGLVASLALTRLMASLLYKVSPTDPETFVEVAVALIGVALLACYVPARRAMRVDPMVALRHE